LVNHAKDFGIIEKGSGILRKRGNVARQSDSNLRR